MALDIQSTLSQIWEKISVEELSSIAAKTLDPGNPTDAGKMWRLPTTHPNPIVLASGIPDDDTLPTKELIEGLINGINNFPVESLTYGGWFGYDECRKAIANRQNRIENINLNENNIILHNGSSGCLENILNAFIEPNDVVIVESPSYSGTIRCIQGSLAEVIEVPIHLNGIDAAEFQNLIEKIKKEQKRIKFFYTIPDYQNPTGNVAPIETREAILKICAENKILIIEDAAYSELYFDQPPPPTYFSLSTGFGVLRMCSFSKVVATGLRLGWIQARDEYIEILTKVRFDMGNSPLIHYALTNFINNKSLDSHVENMRRLYKEKCSIMVDSIKENCGDYMEINPPEGGYFLWLKSHHIKSDELIKAAAQEGLVFPTGSVFFLDKSQGSYNYRLAFTQPSKKQLEEVGVRLKKAYEKCLD
ncbi:MAG: PLP-dependent aminotransferase family protein [SAR202 cluster bacterium]|nr:PLP-dependent aminotransferase family protein [SAR202 cluster bacterium]